MNFNFSQNHMHCLRRNFSHPVSEEDICLFFFERFRDWPAAEVGLLFELVQKIIFMCCLVSTFSFS